MNMRLLKIFAVLGSLLLAFGCGGGGGGGGTGGGGGDGGGDVTPVAAKLDLTTSNYQLDTDGLDTATITVVTRDNNNAAVSGVVVDLSASAGLLSAAQVTTNASGTASITFSPGPDKTNQVVTISAASGNLRKDLPITLGGTTLALTSTKSSLLSGVNDTATLTVRILDAAGSPIPGATITLASTKGNRLSSNGGAPATSITVTTNVSGTATATLTALANPGIDTITASGLGATTSIDINVSNQQFGFTSPADNATIAVNASTVLTVTWTDAAGSPVAGQLLTFTTTGGFFDNVIGKTTTTAVTTVAGTATVTYTASSTATAADITVVSGNESDTLRLLVAAINPSQLSLQVAPSVLGPSVGGVNSSSTVTAIVRDANGQLVSGQTVVFTIEDGPGGGESLSPGTAVTDAGGSASVTFTSGSAVSAQNGVRIRATLQANAGIFNETTLTIAREATSVILGETNRIRVVTVDDLAVGYALPFSVLVVDANGNPVPNATVNLGVYPVSFYTGYDTNTSNINPNPVYTGKFANEDLNRNGFLDAGEDGARGVFEQPDDSLLPSIWLNGSNNHAATIVPDDGTPFTGNGRLDPGGVVTIPESVVTGSDGLAAFEIKYAKAFGNWVDVEITASTQVFGDVATSRLETMLLVQESDDPFPNSPFGF